MTAFLFAPIPRFKITRLVGDSASCGIDCTPQIRPTREPSFGVPSKHALPSQEKIGFIAFDSQLAKHLVYVFLTHGPDG